MVARHKGPHVLGRTGTRGEGLRGPAGTAGGGGPLFDFPGCPDLPGQVGDAGIFAVENDPTGVVRLSGVSDERAAFCDLMALPCGAIPPRVAVAMVGTGREIGIGDDGLAGPV